MPNISTDEPWLTQFRDEIRNEVSSVRLPNLGELAAGFVTLATLVLIAGGVVLWIRLGHADLPQAEAMTVIPRETLLTLGARELAAPILFYSFLYLVLRPMGNIDRRRAENREKPLKWDIANGGEWVVTGFFTLAAVTLLTASWGWHAIWIALVFAFFGYIIHRQIPISFGVLLVVGAVIATGNVITKEIDSPVKLNQARIRQTNGTVTLGLHVSSTSSYVYLGIAGELVGLPNDEISRIRISDPPSAPEPPDSLSRRAVSAIGNLF